ncbi:hypothetical protein IWQ62_001769 [Dispira parvispora]|uniref:Fungal lipase-type domain-containing protein n=1 Tax=Dispira parvispora TaxID=1520584 RepID=A0A9W8AU94_9FUNG|nr:hypothetical protein IWQ62_001769 [Dispira parvispora]
MVLLVGRGHAQDDDDDDHFEHKEVTEEEINNLKVYAQLAAISYDDLKTWSCSDCSKVPDSDLVDFFTSKDELAVGYIAYNHGIKSVTLAFRGTATDEQWEKDLKFYKEDWPEEVEDSEVHTGFLEIYQTVADQVYDRATESLKEYPDYNLTIVGHSLGGALASLAAVDFTLRNKTLTEITNVVTFGKPRVGNEEYAAHYNSLHLNSTRVVNKEDLVPHLPPESFNYRQEGVQLWILPNSTSNASEWCYEYDNEENPNCSDSLSLFELSTKYHHWAWDIEM